MKQVFRLVVPSLIVFGFVQLSSDTLKAQGQSREGVCFYTDENFRGDSYCLGAGESRRNIEDRYNDQFSSVRVFGGAQVIVYEDEGFRGSRTTFTSDVSNLRNWNDKITSIQVTGGRLFGGQTGDREPDRRSRDPYEDWDRDNRGRNGVCFYTEENYRGERYCAEVGESRRNVDNRFNDRFSSVRIYGSAAVTVFEDEGFGGGRTVFTRSVPNLTSWNDRITSFQVVRNSGGLFGGNPREPEYGSPGRNNDPRNGACFYTDEDFRGDRFCLNSGDRVRNVEDRFNDRISSVQLFGRAQVTLYGDENFSSSRRTINRDVRNLGDFNDRLTSVEVR